MPGLKGLHLHELAHRWMDDLETRPLYEFKSGMIIPRYANIGADCGSAKHGTIWGIIKMIYTTTGLAYARPVVVLGYTKTFIHLLFAFPIV